MPSSFLWQCHEQPSVVRASRVSQEVLVAKRQEPASETLIHKAYQKHPSLGCCRLVATSWSSPARAREKGPMLRAPGQLFCLCVLETGEDSKWQQIGRLQWLCSVLAGGEVWLWEAVPRTKGGILG